MADLRTSPHRIVLSGILSLAAVSAAFFVPASTLAATPTAAATTATTTTCGEGRWPASVQGVPLAFHAGARAGDYVWHDSTGWHIRFTHVGTAKVVFSGTIVADTALIVAPYRLEAGDSFALSADRKTLTYRFTNFGRIDGLDVRTACATRLWFRGSMAGVKLPTGRIWLGHWGLHPIQNPFVVLRNR